MTVNKKYMKEYDEKRKNLPKRIKQKKQNNDKYYKIKRKELIQNASKYQRGLRIRLIELLGGMRCNNKECLVIDGCTDIRCLQIDHKNGGGVQDYKKRKHHETAYLYYLNHPELAKKNLQVLCANCNWIKRSINKEQPFREINK